MTGSDPMPYVDGFLTPVPGDGYHAYMEFARISARVFREYGALDQVECWGEDLPEGELTSFPQAVNAAEGETVVLSFVLWPDRATRDAAMEGVMNDPRISPKHVSLPFDARRMVFGGFDMVLGDLMTR